MDRLARSVRGLAQILEDLDRAGVAFRSATEPFDTTTAAGRMMVQMLGVFAEFERATIIDRVIAGMERKAATGQWCGSALPFGYDVDGDSGHLTVNPSEAPLVATIFQLYGHGRLGARAIATRLNQQGRRTKAGRPSNHTAILTVLATGCTWVRCTSAAHTIPHRTPSLVDAELFGLVEDVLADRNEHVSKRAANGSDYLLAGLVVCAMCGERFVGNAAHGRRYRYRYYMLLPAALGHRRLRR